MAARSLPFYPRLRSILESLGELSEEAGAELEVEYADLFVVARTGGGCPLNESAHLDPTGRRWGLLTLEVERAYAAAGRAVDPSAGESPDHAALELEFLGALCQDEAEAWSRGLRSPACECLNVQAGFLDRHLLRWFGLLVRAIDAAADEKSLYRNAAEAAEAFLVHDRDLIDAIVGWQLPAEVEHASAR